MDCNKRLGNMLRTKIKRCTDRKDRHSGISAKKADSDHDSTDKQSNLKDKTYRKHEVDETAYPDRLLLNIENRSIDRARRIVYMNIGTS